MGMFWIQVKLIFILLLITHIDVYSQSIFVGGLPYQYFDNTVAGCGTHHFLVNANILFRSNNEHSIWDTILVAPAGERFTGIHSWKGILFLGTGGLDILRSDDCGSSWDTVGTDVSPYAPISIFQSNDSIIYINGQSKFAVSHDGGFTFESKFSLTNGGPAAYYKNFGVYLDNETPNPTLITSQDHFRTSQFSNANDIHRGKPTCMTVLDSTFFVGVTGNSFVYRSSDKGFHWDSVFIDSSVNAVYNFYNDHSGLWAATDAGLFRSNAPGTTWVKMEYDQTGGWPEGKPNTNEIDFIGDTGYAVIHKSVLMRSLDHGVHWNEAQKGVYAGTALNLYSDGRHLCAWSDYGQSIANDPYNEWTSRRNAVLEQFPNDQWPYSTWLNLEDAEFMYYPDLYASYDQGQNWEMQIGNVDDLISQKDTLWCAQSRKVYYSFDQGHNWNTYGAYGTMPSSTRIRSIVRFKGNLVMVANFGSNTKIYTASGIGATAQLKNTVNSFWPQKFTTDNDSLVALGIHDGITLSKNGGFTWNSIYFPEIINNNVHELLYKEGIILVASTVGLWAYDVKSDTWIEVEPNTFGNKEIYNLAEHDGHVFAAVVDLGIYEIDFDHIVCLLNPKRSDCGKIVGSIYYTLGDSCKRDSNAIPLPKNLVEINPGPIFATTQSSGQFLFPLDTGFYEVRSVNPPGYYFNLICPDTGYYSIHLDPYHVSADSIDFFYQLIPNIRDLTIDIIPWPRISPGLPTYLFLYFENKGTVPIAPTIKLAYDTAFTFVEASIVPVSSTSSQLEWKLDTLQPLQSDIIAVTFLVDPKSNIGDFIHLKATILPLEMDTISVDNIDSLKQVIKGSYDPNDKLVEPVGEGELGIVPEGTKTFQYTIRFQNSGNDTAFSVKILDTLDSRFDSQTFQILSSNPDEVVASLEKNILFFEFPGIMLPDSNVNLLGSSGYVKYKISTKAALTKGEEIRNQAHIIFDANDPISTNITLNTIESPVSTNLPLPDTGIMEVYPVPSSGYLFIKLINIPLGGYFSVITPDGRKMNKPLTITRNNLIEINLSDLTSGLYFISYIKNNHVFSTKKISILK